ncbi:MAG: hypothetical protein J3Q66DRAFT_370712 [Benniella sp.]|nr:MAG: hypothetical protein J3Q66DRAFT_370712 [Benniella sp.]
MYKSSLLVLLGMVAVVAAAGCNEEAHDRAGLEDVFLRHSRQFCSGFGQQCFMSEECCQAYEIATPSDSPSRIAVVMDIHAASPGSLELVQLKWCGGDFVLRGHPGYLEMHVNLH